MSATKNTLFGYFKKVESPNRPKHENAEPMDQSSENKPNQTTPKTPSSKKQVVKPDTPSTPLTSGPSKNNRAKTPKSSSKAIKRKPLTPANGPKAKPLKRARLAEEEDWDDEPPSEEEEDVESGDDYKPQKDEDTDSEGEEGDPEDDDAIETPVESEDESPVKKTPRRSRVSTSTAATTPKTPNLAQSVSRNPSEWQHMGYEFLQNPKDGAKRAPDHPEYDSSTLNVPDDFKSKLTPGMRQWWDLKESHFDTVLFFKVGKFYELYHMDAVIGVEHLGLTYMKGEWAHSGFPEVALQRNMEALVQKGFKCARVEQTETPAMMEERCKKAVKTTKFDKVVRREICNISSKGVQLCGADICGSSYLLALRNKEKRFGVCLVDTTVGRFHVGEFEDDHQLSSVRTLISRFAPVEAILERNLNADVKRIIESIGAKIETPSSKKCMTAEKALTIMREKNFFEQTNYPEALQQMLSEDDPLMSTPKNGFELACSALATIVGRLDEALVLEDVLSMGQFEAIEFKYDGISGDYLPKMMIMDSVALTNLEIFQNSVGTTEGTLLSTINFCSTAFGVRQLKNWLLGPSCVAAEIEARWDAVGDLMNDLSLLKKAQERLKKLPDMDKMLARIHALSLKKENHPDSRAILYSDDVYSKRKIEDFCNVLDGFRDTLALCRLFKDADLNSSLLNSLVVLESEGGQFPDLKESLDFFDRAFDKTKALKDGKIVPAHGVDEEFDQAQKNIAQVKQTLDDHLKDQCKHFGTKVTYVGAGRTAYQIEVPEAACSKATSEHHLQGNRKGFKRYYTDESQRLCQKMLQAEEARDATSKDILRRIFAVFDDKRTLWRKAIDCISILDCLMSLALYGTNAGGSVCRPRIVEEASKPMLRIANGSHPCLLKRLGEDKLIANDFSLGVVDEGRCDGSCVALLTGPNMGGKSTLMRQVGLLVVMAQLGAWVPAQSMEFTLVDRIFTRLGASDHITLGESTFLVEMLETSSVFKHSTKNSLVLLDELGRGTSTNDGASLAYAVLDELSRSDRRTLFSTHYHDLANDIKSVFLGHMACIVESDEDVVFLYKFVPGNCEKSFGFNVARLAGLPQKIVTLGQEKSKQLEEQSQLLQKFAKYMTV